MQSVPSSRIHRFSSIRKATLNRSVSENWSKRGSATGPDSGIQGSIPGKGAWGSPLEALQILEGSKWVCNHDIQFVWMYRVFIATAKTTVGTSSWSTAFCSQRGYRPLCKMGARKQTENPNQMCGQIKWCLQSSDPQRHTCSDARTINLHPQNLVRKIKKILIEIHPHKSILSDVISKSNISSSWTR